MNSPLNISVTLNVSSQPNLSASPFGMVFSYQIGGSPAAMQMAVISNQGTPISFALSAETISGGNWLMAAGGGTTPTTIAAAIDTGNLAPGTYTGNLVMKPTSGTGNPLRMPVILNVSPSPVFMLNANQVSFQYQTTGPVPQPQKVNITTTGTPSVVFYTATETGNGGKWLKVSPDVTSSPSDVTVSVDPLGLAAGVYYGIVVLTAASGDTPPSYIPVSLQISDDQILTVPAQPLTFNVKVGSGPTAAQTITVKGTGRASAFQVNTYGGSWLTVSPTTGTADATLNVVAVPDSLPAGYYFGSSPSRYPAWPAASNTCRWVRSVGPVRTRPEESGSLPPRRGDRQWGWFCRSQPHFFVSETSGGGERRFSSSRIQLAAAVELSGEASSQGPQFDMASANRDSLVPLLPQPARDPGYTPL